MFNHPALRNTTFAKFNLDRGGSTNPLIIPSEFTEGLGIMNPSIMNDNGKLRGIVRNVNYTFYHSEAKLFNHPYGPLTYIHPENDLHLRTRNWYIELDDNYNITRYNLIDTSQFDTYEPQWEFVGLEDARIVRWEDKLYITGVRRDTTTNGEGRMELSEIQVNENSVVEVDRYRIPTVDNVDSYCEKNWMPFTDTPYQFMKWSNPAEVVKSEMHSNKTEMVFDGSKKFKKVNFPNDLRGGSQVIPFGKDHYIALLHEVELFQSETKRKDAIYLHRFIIWDKNYQLVGCSRNFSIMGGHVEFSIGMCEYDNDILITFGYQDNGAYILKTNKQTIVDFINEKH